tara:strand:- start:3071 stop:3514 length:444 start_codon:yes stop_codon:yes gene_type:complete
MATYSDARNPRWADTANTNIIVEVDFDHLDEDWVECVVMASGDMPHIHDLHAECLDGDYGAIGAYVPPPALTGDDAMNHLRQTRNEKLAETDYLALGDNTLSSEMTTYRQALRDLPSNSANCSITFEEDGSDVVVTWNNVTWPTKPS